MILEDRIKRLYHHEKEVRTIAITELISVWEQEKNVKIFDILFQRYLIENDEKLINLIANGLKMINPLKSAAKIQEMYEKEQVFERKSKLVELLMRITSKEIENYFYSLLANEDDKRLVNQIKNCAKIYRKVIIESQKINSPLGHWEEVEYDASIEEKFCMICKLKFDESHGILRCPFCHACFHTEHLLDWLIEKSVCPVCDREIEEL